MINATKIEINNTIRTNNKKVLAQLPELINLS